MIKLIPEQINFHSECCSCLSTANCYELVIRTDYGTFPITVTVCKNCLKELQKQIKEHVEDV